MEKLQITVYLTGETASKYTEWKHTHAALAPSDAQLAGALIRAALDNLDILDKRKQGKERK